MLSQSKFSKDDSVKIVICMCKLKDLDTMAQCKGKRNQKMSKEASQEEYLQVCQAHNPGKA